MRVMAWAGVVGHREHWGNGGGGLCWQWPCALPHACMLVHAALQLVAACAASDTFLSHAAVQFAPGCCRAPYPVALHDWGLTGCPPVLSLSSINLQYSIGTAATATKTASVLQPQPQPQGLLVPQPQQHSSRSH